MRRLLSSLSYDVMAFSSAAEFLASPKLANTTCLVADVHMSAMSGIQLYEHLIDTGHVIPTILVTAYPDARARERMLNLGVECYLAKPLIEELLISCLSSAIARGTGPQRGDARLND